jgi:hypothetical protein
VQEISMNGSDTRGLHPWIADARTFFPVPLSPVSRTVTSEAAAWRAIATARCIAGLFESSSAGSSTASRSVRFSRRSCWTSSTRSRSRLTWSRLNGFTR